MMKRCRAVVPVFVLTCAVWAMPAGAEPLEVAIFEADVTPPMGSPLCNGYRPPVKRIDLPLSARGVVLLTEADPIVLCSVDWVIISNGGQDAWREELAEAAGTPVERVVVHAMHPHDAPGCDFTVEALLKDAGLSGKMFDPSFARQAIARTAEAVRKAMTRPVTVTHLGIGQAEVRKVASNRRILGADGKVKYGRMSSCGNAKVRAAPEGVIDPILRTVSLWAGDKPIVAMSYYATHPQCNYGRGGVSADFVGMARRAREKALPGVAQIYFSGAGGDIAVGKYNDGSKGTREKLAKRLADGMARAWEATQRSPVDCDDVELRVLPVALPPRESLNEAQLLERIADPKAKLTRRIFAGRDLAWLRRCKAGRKMDLSCLKLGETYVLHMPGELCIAYQLAAQKMRPNHPVCMAAYVGLGPGYIPPAIAYEQGGYEASSVCRVAPETEEILMAAMRRLLR